VLLLSLTVSSILHAQDYISAPPPPQTVAYASAQLDQMLAPIALYPDPLVAQILMASTYPLEVVEASRWLQDPASAALTGQQLAWALQQQPWDPSVKSLVPFPQVLRMMDSNLQWTERLGDAFLAQQVAVMDSVQRLRRQAQAAGALTSTPQQVVSIEGPDILIEPVNPDVVYVPAYNPTVAYGAWPYPGYPPYDFYPSGYYPGPALIGFGAGIVVAESLRDWDRWDWRRHRIDLDDRRFSELNRDRLPVSSGVWQHDPAHRGGVPYRDPALRERFQAAAAPEARRSFRGYEAAPAAPQINKRAAFENSRAAASARDIRPDKGVPRMEAPRIEAPRVEAPRVEAPHIEAPRVINRMPEFERREQTTARPAFNNAPGAARFASPPVTRNAPPMFESFSRGPDVRAQSARGSMSRASPPPSGGNRGGNRDGNDDRRR
jgi:hypothetical protein